MKYSVIIPAYKCESTLEKTVNSIQKCGLSNFEIILVDDGSPDNTPPLCDRLADEMSNVRCLHQANRGVSSARNHGLTEARGDYVWFFDSDDLVDPDSMIRLSQIVDDCAPDMLIFGMSFDFYNNDVRYARWDYSYKEERLYSLNQLEEKFEEYYYKNAFFSSCNKLISSEILRSNQIKFLEEMHVMEDFQFVLRVLSKCKTIYIFPEPIYRYLHFRRKNKKKLDPSVERALRIKDIGVYMNYFEPYLLKHRKLLVQLHFMLLRQKICAQSPCQMRETASQFRNSRFVEQQYLSLCTPADLKLAKWLMKNRCYWIYLRRKLGDFKRYLLKRFK